MSVLLTADFLAQTSFSIAKSYWPSFSVAELQREWARKTLQTFDISCEVLGEPSSEKPLLFVGNHISYVDIVLLMRFVPEICFVAKKEIASWPLFGHAARVTKTILVQREKSDSRKAAREAIEEALGRHQRIAIFPSGTTTLDESQNWRRGVFEIAHKNQVKIQPFRLTYKPLRPVAYIDDDFFPLHMFRLLGHKNIQAVLEFHEPVLVTDVVRDCDIWWAWSRQSAT